VHKKKIYLLACIVLSLLFVIFWFIPNKEEEPQRIIPWHALAYVEVMNFWVSFYLNGDRIVASHPVQIGRLTRPYHNPNFDPSFTEFIVVDNAEEAKGHLPHVIVAWPDDDFIPGRIAGLHWAVGRTVFTPGWAGRSTHRSALTFEEFGLSYPLTRSDFIENWEAVFKLWEALDEWEQSRIWRLGRKNYVPDYLFEQFP